MSWIQKLYETYENCELMVGNVPENEVPLLPICHTTQKAHVEIVIDQDGSFNKARIVNKDHSRTIIPCTESSGGRTGKKPEHHPLCDKLQYIAGDFTEFGGEVTIGYKNDRRAPFRNYCELLAKWCDSQFSHPKASTVLEYIKKGTVVKDLVDEKILLIGDDGKLMKKWTGDKKDKPVIFSLFQNTAWQADAFIRWEVEADNDPCSKVWEDKTLWDSWIKYYLNTKRVKAFCYVTGNENSIAEKHPANLRRDGDKAKLISSNDWAGFTFRGRFTDTKKHNTYQTCGVGFEVTQKAHNALRWLISRQGYRSRNGDQAVVAWSTSGAEIHQLLDDHQQS